MRQTRHMAKDLGIYDAIGRVVSESAHLESAYGRLVESLCGGLAWALVRGASPGQLKTAARKMIGNGHIAPDIAAQCEEALKAADALLVKRHHVVHGEWFKFSEDEDWTTEKPVRNSLSGEQRQWSIAELHDLAHLMVETQLLLYNATWNVTSTWGGSGMPVKDKDVRGKVMSAHLDSPEEPPEPPLEPENFA